MSVASIPLLISKAFEVGTVHFGPRLLAFAAFQKMICGVSYDKIRLGFEQMLGFPVARSTLCRAMQRLARRAKPTRDALVEALRASPVVYADETGWKQGGRRVWLWVFTNLRETVYEILPGRGFEQAASVLGKNYAGTLGVDGWAGDVPAAVEFGRVAAAPVNTLRQQPHRCQEISVCF